MQDCSRENKCRVSMTKVAFNRKALFVSKLDLNLNKKLGRCCILEMVM